jgi:hypothetical protein
VSVCQAPSSTEPDNIIYVVLHEFRNHFGINKNQTRQLVESVASQFESDFDLAQIYGDLFDISLLANDY